MTKEDFLQWKNSRATQEVFNYLKAQRDRHREALIPLGREGNPIQSARVSGICEAFDHLLNIDYQDAPESGS